MNPKLVALLHEGYSISTLENLTEGQLNLLYEKTKKIKKEPKEIINVKKGSEEEKDLMSKGAIYNTYGETEVTEKAVSKKQRGLMGAAYSVEKGDKDIKDIPKSYRKSVEKVVDSMSKKQVKDFASTKDEELGEGKKFIQKATKKMESKGTEGKFGRWCKKEGLDSEGEVTKKCISAAMKSDNPDVVKMANFANNIGGFKGSYHKKKTESKENVKKLEENILRLIEDHLPPTTTKGELLKTIKSFKR